MSRQPEPSGTSPSAIASNWLDDQLVPVLASVRQRLRKHVVLMTLGAAAVSGIGAFSIWSLQLFGVWQIPGSMVAAALAATSSVATTVALYPVLRSRERWLFKAVSAITHDNIGLMSVLGKLTELRNGETAGHNLRVTLHTLCFAEALGLPPDEIVRTLKGALLHDVGKLAVPDFILAKPGPLTPAEREEMDKHVNFGLEIISQSGVLHEAAAVVGGHHERYDGKGYPQGLKGEEIPREARLFALVDVFDALTSMRIYKPAYTIEEAVAIMTEGRGSHFDPTLFDHFVAHAPALARRLPQDDAAIAALLMDRLLPYFELLVFQRAIPGPLTAAIAAGVGRS